MPETRQSSRQLTKRRWPMRPSGAERRRLATVLRDQTAGGMLLVVAAAVALVWANSPVGDTYFELRDTKIGPASLHLDLTLGAWASDGLLALFFFVAAIELKREFVAGELRDPRRAVVPVAAAFGGVALPAVIYLLVTRGTPGAVDGWAIPVATDIAFALAVLAVIGSHLPTALRTFLLTLAVVDDLIAIVIIALFFTTGLDPVLLAAALVPLGLFALLARRNVRSWSLLLPLAAITWGLVHASGVHATIAGVMLGFAMPVFRERETRESFGAHCEHLLQPLSAGFAVPVFAFFAAGVAVGGASGLVDALGASITLGIVFGLFAGKTIGVLGTTWLMTKATNATLDDSLTWTDIAGVAMLAGVGFTVSLLVGDIAFGDDPEQAGFVKVGVLCGSLLSATLAAILLGSRNRHYRRLDAL